MANEGYYSITFKATKNGATVSQTVSKRISMTGAGMLQATQNIGTTAELLTLESITGTPQVLLVQNLDATNYVELGGDSGLTVFKVKIPAGEARFVTTNSGTIYAKANTAAVEVLKVAIDA
jgi:hypothetical protein